MPYNNDDLYLNNTKVLGKLIKDASKAENEYRSDFGEHEHDDFLNVIQGIESSFGKDTEHDTMESGMHKGQRAIGKFGLMPKTVKDIASKLKNREVTNLGQSLPHKARFPELEGLRNVPEDSLEEKLRSNEDLELRAARMLAQDVLKRQGGDQERAAYSWLMGHNKQPEDITQEDLDNAEYVQKFRKIRKMLEDQSRSVVDNQVKPKPIP